MSSKLRWMPDWLTGPSLGQYLRVRPGEKTQHAQADTSEAAASEEKGLNSTKQILKKHMVDSFFERALHQMDPSQVEDAGLEDEALPVEKPAEVASGVDAYVDVALHEPIYEAEMPLDDDFLVVEEDQYEVSAQPAPEVHELDEDDLMLDDVFLEAELPPPFEDESDVDDGEIEEAIGSYFEEELADEDDPTIIIEDAGVTPAAHQKNANFEESGLKPDDAPSLEPEEPVGYYVFAITLGQFEFSLPSLTMDENYPLFVFPFGSAQAVISKVPLDVYSERALQARLNDPAWFEQTLRTHNSILGKIQSQASIVPMRVCTICDSMEVLEAFLNEHHDDFVSTLQLIDGNRTWRFRIYCNEPRLRKLTARASNRVRAIQAEMAGKSQVAAQALYEKLESVLEEEARSVCRACVKHSHGTLSTIAVKNKKASIPQQEAGTPEKREIFRCDYLVSVTSKHAFGNELTSLIEAYKSLGFELEVEGPHSPAQFADRKVLPVGEAAQEMKKEVRPVTVDATQV